MESGEAEICDAFLPVKDVWTLSIFAFSYASSVAFTASLIRLARRRVEIKHPVFALVMQELLIIGSCEFLALVNVLVQFYFEFEDNVSHRLGYGLLFVASQSHQMTWLGISCLRYYLLVRVKPSDAVNMNHLRRKSLSLYWIFSLPPLTAGVAFTFVLSRWIRNINPSPVQVFLIAIGLYIPFNLADFCSIAIFVRMLHHFKTKVSPHAAAQEMVLHEGIWVGDVFEFVQAEPQHGDPQVQPSSDHDAKSVIAVLRKHVAVSLIDFLLILLGFSYCYPKVGKVIVHLNQQLISCWIPLFVIKYGFKQFK